VRENRGTDQQAQPAHGDPPQHSGAEFHGDIRGAHLGPVRLLPWDKEGREPVWNFSESKPPAVPCRRLRSRITTNLEAQAKGGSRADRRSALFCQGEFGKSGFRTVRIQNKTETNSQEECRSPLVHGFPLADKGSLYPAPTENQIRNPTGAILIDDRDRFVSEDPTRGRYITDNDGDLSGS